MRILKRKNIVAFRESIEIEVHFHTPPVLMKTNACDLNLRGSTLICALGTGSCTHNNRYGAERTSRNLYELPATRNGQDSSVYCATGVRY